MTHEVVEIINWNIAWNSRRTRAGKIIQKIPQERRSDILCLCESHVDFLADQHGIFSEGDYGYAMTPGRRKVALWSHTPWKDISTTLPNAPPGRSSRVQRRSRDLDASGSWGSVSHGRRRTSRQATRTGNAGKITSPICVP